MDGHGHIEQEGVFARVLKVEHCDQSRVIPKECIVGKDISMDEPPWKGCGNTVPQVRELLDKETEQSG